MLGLIDRGYAPQTDAATNVEDGIAYKLMRDHFFKQPERIWQIDELISSLNTTKPTIYRYIHKMDALDLLERVKTPKLGYRIRYGDLSRAWGFTELHVKLAMENYRKTIDHITQLMRSDVENRT